MQNAKGLKRLLVLLAIVSLLVAMLPTAVMAQDSSGEGDTQTEQTADHGEEGAVEDGGPLAAFGINLGFLIAQVVNFLFIAAVLTAVLWKPAVNMLDVRSQKIQKGLEDAAAAAKARQNAEVEADKILAEARSDRQKLLEEARQQGDDVRKQIEGEARQEADRIRKEAQQDAVAARNVELAGLRDQVLQISTAVAGRILQENIDGKKQQKLVSDFFSKVPDGAKNLSGEVEIVSAMPLDDSEKKAAEKAIKADSYAYTVDPEILGGIIVRSQDRVVDGSVRGSLGELSGRLK